MFKLAFATGVSLFLMLSPAYSQSSDGDAANDWPMYRGGLTGTGYSALGEINPNNVAQLDAVWRYSLMADGSEGGDQRAAAPNSQATPIVVGGLMYVPAADRVVALDPVSGQEVWRYSVREGRPSRRGVAYWPGTQTIAPRIVFTTGGKLLALNAVTGIPAADFGDNGEVELGIPYLSVPLVYDNIVVVGANTPPGAPGGIGNPRAFDARTGEKLWEFSSVPQPGEIGHGSWEGDSWINRLGANAWPFYFTVDAERDLLYLPLASPIPFAYGGDRSGTNLFANSIVAVNVYTGAYVWHFQTIHHDLWDHDPPAPPTLFDIQRENGSVPALAVTTKSGYLFFLNRETGEPLYDVQERPVPASEVPGEQAFATQPIPAITPPMSRVSYSAADLVAAADTSADHAAACEELVASTGEIVNDGPYTPWVYSPEGSPQRSTLLFPGLAGGPNWGGVAYDPASRLAFVFAANLGSFGWVEDASDGSALPYQRGGPRPANFQVQLNGQSLPCQKPPWGQLSAVNVESGELVWQIALGVSDSLPSANQNTGRPGRAGALVTASNLLFIAATDDNRFRALEATSGRQLWETQLDQRGNANPMTYLGSDERQYLVIAATNEVVTYRLP